MEIISETPDYKYGGFWRRFVAFIIDDIVVTIIYMIGILLFTDGVEYYFNYNDITSFDDIEFFPILKAQLIYLVLEVVYYAGMHSSSKQATIGKMCLDMKVIDSNGEKISFLRGVGRYFAKFLSGIILLIGYIMAAFSSKKQALHDKLANTYVIVEG